MPTIEMLSIAKIPQMENVVKLPPTMKSDLETIEMVKSRMFPSTCDHVKSTQSPTTLFVNAWGGTGGGKIENDKGREGNDNTLGYSANITETDTAKVEERGNMMSLF
jgi:hypothetical protein